MNVGSLGASARAISIRQDKKRLRENETVFSKQGAEAKRRQPTPGMSERSS
jgi:hypothetical protein